ncbi:unnamed protein product [Coffea canephora]|uniref:Uncharacterized protein n=1 Tax=Coffea canephora TaxID=49390 RepID=A0A068V247_COFCA|nr:unnamed protein product [Coffea canephora]
MLSLGSFKTEAILLARLFVYDIFWVFFTQVMISVVKSFDAPIECNNIYFLQFLFPTADSAGLFSMLALGYTVILGMAFILIALIVVGEQNQYFKSAFVGYSVGLILTIIIMNWFQAAQVGVLCMAALLYIVLAVIEFLAVHVFWKGEVKPVSLL